MKLTKIILEQEDMFVPRRSQEERDKARLIQVNRYIQEYMKNGSKGNLDLNGAPITSLPKELTYVGGELYLMSSAILNLPEGLKVEGSLYLKDTPITSLPEGLEVSRWLVLTSTLITSLPKDIKVGDALFISKTPLTKKYNKAEIAAMYPGVQGKIYV